MYPLRCDIHSADRILPQLQELHTGDLILLAPTEAPCFRVATVEPRRVLVLAGTDPKSRAVWPVPATPDELANVWQWVLRPAASGRGTRLVVRQRYCYPRRQAALWHFVEAVSFVMEHRMLHGIQSPCRRPPPSPPRDLTSRPGGWRRGLWRPLGQPIWARLWVPSGGTFVPVMPVTTG
jgi:hypothetical protein